MAAGAVGDGVRSRMQLRGGDEFLRIPPPLFGGSGT